MYVCSEACSLPTGELSQYGNRHQEEMASLQNGIATLDREKDALQDEVDHKTEKVVALQEENCRKVHEAATPFKTCYKWTEVVSTFHQEILLVSKQHLKEFIVRPLSLGRKREAASVRETRK